MANNKAPIIEHFPELDEIAAEVKKLKSVRLGDSSQSLARPSVASDAVDQGFNIAITFHRNAAALFQGFSGFFSRDNVALPGVALYFKVIAQAEISDSYVIVDFLTRRGAIVDIGPTFAPPHDWAACEESSDVVNAFTQTLAVFKVQYNKANELFGVAQKHGDGHAQFVLGKSLAALSEKIRDVSHYVAHVKIVESDKHAIKAFDRRLPYEIQDCASAAAVESIIPSRHSTKRMPVGTAARALAYQTKALDVNSALDDGSKLRLKLAYQQVI